MNVATLNALAEPNRLRIVEMLREKPYPVGEIALHLALRQPQVSKHLRVLTHAGIVRVEPIANQRIYRLQSKPFQEMDRWLDTFRKIWEKRLDTLDAYLQEMKQEELHETKHHKPKLKT